MIFRNSVKLFFSNFSTVWKLMLYYIVITLIGVGLVAPIFSSVGQVFRDFGFFEQVVDVLTQFNLGSNITSIFADLGKLFIILLDCIVAYFTTHTWLAVYLSFLFVVLLPFLYGLGSLSVGESLYGYMSSQTKVSFTGRIFSSLKTSIKYLLAKILVTAPINVFIFYAMSKLFTLTALTGPIRFAVPFFITVAFCILLALRVLIFSGWVPALIVNNCGVWKAFGIGIKAVGRKFFKCLSTLIILMLLNVCIEVLFGSIAFLILIPTGVYFTYLISFVMFYESQGMRYYVDPETIVTPKRLEQVDRYSRCRDII